MWILIIIGGGLVVVFVGPITFATDVEPIITSGVKVLLCIIFDIHLGVYSHKNSRIGSSKQNAESSNIRSG